MPLDALSSIHPGSSQAAGAASRNDRLPASSEPSRAQVTSPVVHLLAYVHMRNIHASTGAGRVARQLVEHLALRDDVRLRVLADARDHARIVPLVGEPWTSFSYDLFARDTSRQQALWFAIDRPRAEAFWPQADVVFCTAESYVPVKRARLVVTLHDAAYFEQSAHPRDFAFRKQQWKWKLLYGKLARKVDMFHTVSAFSAQRLAHFFPEMAGRLRVVPNAVSPHFLQPVPAAGRAYLEREGLADRPFVLVPGGLHYRKNAELILEASPALLRQFPGLVIAVINHSSAEYRQRAQAMAPMLGPDFRLLGFVDDDALHALYSAAQVVWFPSRYEGFGMPVIEAMACGAPVVASDASSVPEVAGEAALLVDPSSLRAHVRAIASLLTDELARSEYRRAGLARASLYNWTSSADTLKKCIDTLL